MALTIVVGPIDGKPVDELAGVVAVKRSRLRASFDVIAVVVAQLVQESEGLLGSEGHPVNASQIQPWLIT